MLILSLGLALLSWPERVEPPLMITVPVAATDPQFMDRPVEVCGHLVAVYPEQNEAMMVGRGKSLMVDMRGRAEFLVGRAACVTGVIRRRDGESELQRRNSGLGFTTTSHAPSPDFLLYQCHDPASCGRLMEPGPVRPDQLDLDPPPATTGQRGI